MEEVTIRLQGGLGNYMFQIASVYAYAIKQNKKAVFTIDDSVVIHKNLESYKENILSNVEFIANKNTINLNSYSEIGFNYSEIPLIKDNVVLNGYFQSDKYFKEYTVDIKQLFSYPTSYIEAIKEKYKFILFQNTCSIHVRRGDYLKSPDHHPAQNMNYYMKAIKIMPKDSVFLIFSDDIEWCKLNFPDLPEKFKFIEGNSDHEDLLLMSLCNNNIICNSTFSWWAAWLNNNSNKKVTIPTNWFGPAYANYNTEDLYCENWIRI